MSLPEVFRTLVGDILFQKWSKFAHAFSISTWIISVYLRYPNRFTLSNFIKNGISFQVRWTSPLEYPLEIFSGPLEYLIFYMQISKILNPLDILFWKSHTLWISNILHMEDNWQFLKKPNYFSNYAQFILYKLKELQIVQDNFRGETKLNFTVQFTFWGTNLLGFSV